MADLLVGVAVPDPVTCQEEELVLGGEAVARHVGLGRDHLVLGLEQGVALVLQVPYTTHTHTHTYKAQHFRRAGRLGAKGPLGVSRPVRQ